MRTTIVPPHLADLPYAINRATASRPYYYATQANDDLQYQTSFAFWDGSLDGSPVNTGNVCDGFYVDETLIGARPDLNSGAFVYYTINGTQISSGYQKSPVTVGTYSYAPDRIMRYASGVFLNLFPYVIPAVSNSGAMNVDAVSYTSSAMTLDSAHEASVPVVTYGPNGDSNFGLDYDCCALAPDLVVIGHGSQVTYTTNSLYKQFKTEFDFFGVSAASPTSVPGKGAFIPVNLSGNGVAGSTQIARLARLGRRKILAASTAGLHVVECDPATSAITSYLFSSAAVTPIWTGLTPTKFLWLNGSNFEAWAADGVPVKLATTALPGTYTPTGLIRLSDTEALLLHTSAGTTWGTRLTIKADGSVSFGQSINLALPVVALNRCKSFTMPGNRVFLNVFDGTNWFSKIMRAA